MEKLNRIQEAVLAARDVDYGAIQNAGELDEELRKAVLAILGVPGHVGIIMDGNGRWADSRGLGKLEGHAAGVRNIRPIIAACGEYGISVVTVYAFSTENWKRSRDEVKGLMELVGQFVKEVDELDAKGVQLRHFGSTEDILERFRTKNLESALAQKIQNTIQDSIAKTKHNTKMILNIAFNYGGRDEILGAVRGAIRDGVDPSVLINKTDKKEGEEILRRYMFGAGLPDPDLIIRTGGEMRLSNFLLWGAAYAEFWSTRTLWPDFRKEELYRALLDYSSRERRMGGRPSEKSAKDSPA